MARYRKIVGIEIEDCGPVVLRSWKLECGHYTFLKDKHDAPQIGERRLCRRCG